jgi:hypothetical protein
MRILIVTLLFWASAAGAQAWDPKPWLDDLHQMRSAIDEKYANLDWLKEEREVDLDAIFTRVEGRLRSAGSDAAARAVLDRLIDRIGDGHVALDWPAAKSSAPAAPPPPPVPGAAGLCGRLGYDSRQSSAGFTPLLAGYRVLPSGNAFPAGIVTVGAKRLGLLRIGVFQPQGSPALCEAAVAALGVAPDKPCDEACEDSILTWVYRRMTSDLAARAEQLKAAGADALLVDVTGNGGGSEWAEAAARILSPAPIRSGQRGFVRGPHWAKQWRELGEHLRIASKNAKPADRARLLGWAAEADRGVAEAERKCPPGCPRIARLGYATGLVGSAPAGSFGGKDWAVHIFSIAQFPYRDSAWKGPLIVATDQETWSAAEEFAALLQDNRAAVLVGARTGGAGCGHTWGGTPTVLSNSGATLQLPDCVRFRADGSNEVRGVLPDLVVAVRGNDGRGFAARLFEAALPAAIAQAEALGGGGTEAER